jgi:DNA-binding transcriptional ArsR family regulator
VNRLKETNELILQELKNISSKLDHLANVLKLGQSTGIEERKSKLLSNSPLRQKIYSLCDGRNTVSDIRDKSGKSISLVSQVLAKLQESGLVSEERRGSQRIYRQV